MNVAYRSDVYILTAHLSLSRLRLSCLTTDFSFGDILQACKQMFCVFLQHWPGWSE